VSNYATLKEALEAAVKGGATHYIDAPSMVLIFRKKDGYFDKGCVGTPLFGSQIGYDFWWSYEDLRGDLETAIPIQSHPALGEQNGE
jgi:hypothetical protein